MHALSAPCADPRFPALAGPWAVGCGPDGRVDRAVFLPTGRLIPLPMALDTPCVAPGRLWDPSMPNGLIALGAQQATSLPARAWGQQAGPCALDGEQGLAQIREGLEHGAAGAGTRTRLDAAPVGWEAVGLANGWIAWTERINGLAVLHMQAPRAEAKAPPIADGARHVTSAGGALAWIEPQAVASWRPGAASVSRWATHTGFSAPLGFDGLHACWEERARGDLDVRCSDGIVRAGPGDQRAPSRWGPYLLYREGDLPTLWVQVASP